MAKKKKKSVVGKVLFGATAIAAAAGAAALAADKKTRNKVTIQAKSAWKKAQKDPRVKQAGKKAGTLVAKMGQAIDNWFK